MDKMGPWRFLWVLTLVFPLTASNSRADCAACTKSHMVQIQMKSGAAEKGHLAWNSFYIEELLTATVCKSESQRAPCSRTGTGWTSRRRSRVGSKWRISLSERKYHCVPRRRSLS